MLKIYPGLPFIEHVVRCKWSTKQVRKHLRGPAPFHREVVPNRILSLPLPSGMLCRTRRSSRTALSLYGAADDNGANAGANADVDDGTDNDDDGEDDDSNDAGAASASPFSSSFTFSLGTALPLFGAFRLRPLVALVCVATPVDPESTGVAPLVSLAV